MFASVEATFETSYTLDMESSSETNQRRTDISVDETSTEVTTMFGDFNDDIIVEAGECFKYETG